MDNKKLAYALVKCETEEEVIKLLEQEGYWNNTACWRAFGDNENNWSTIGNQQSDADSALVEKIINSIDALLMKECLIRGIEPDSKEAPQSVANALESYFGIIGGKIQNLTNNERTRLAQDSIRLIATGDNSDNPNITIVDCGEGQTPLSMPNTILSINKSNKLKVPFVQGKFNMGGTGVLCFCGENNLQLIISKRCPDIEINSDSSRELWGLTIIRREKPNEVNGMRSSRYTYLTDENGAVLYFSAPEGMEIIPSSDGSHKTMHYGMLCKMYEYKLGRLRSNINMNLYSRLATLLPNLAYPVYLDECRKRFRARTMHRTLSGLNVRLSDQLSNKDSNIEEKVSISFTIDGQKIKADTYVFKVAKTSDSGKEQQVDMGQYRQNEGILLTQNGQTHSSYDSRFYKRNAVGLSYLADRLLTIVDCTEINEATREELFMNSRDRTRKSVFSNKLEQELEEFLSNNETLKEIQQRRRQEALSKKLEDEKPLEDILSSVFKNSPVLSKLFVSGNRIQNPIDMRTNTREKEKYIGEYNPSFFSIVKPKDYDKEVFVRQAQIGRKARIRFLTDANNDFFTRDKYPGKNSLLCNGLSCDNYSLSLRDGVAVLTIEHPSDVAIGDMNEYELNVLDSSVERLFSERFTLQIIDTVEASGGSGTHNHDSGNDGAGNSLGPSGITLPEVIEVDKSRWEELGFTKESALEIKSIDAAHDFYVNMDNIYLLSEIKPIAKSEEKVRLLKARYKYSMVLIGLGILGYRGEETDCEREESERESREELANRATKMISPVILPLINGLSEESFDLV